jgi:hypothetical protein
LAGTLIAHGPKVSEDKNASSNFILIARDFEVSLQYARKRVKTNEVSRKWQMLDFHNTIDCVAF